MAEYKSKDKAAKGSDKKVPKKPAPQEKPEPLPTWATNKPPSPTPK